jgi:hypothetical protein
MTHWWPLCIWKVLRPFNLIKVIIGFPRYYSKCRVDNQNFTLLPHASLAAFAMKILKFLPNSAKTLLNYFPLRHNHRAVHTPSLWLLFRLEQRSSNFFEVGTTFISQNSSADHLTLVHFESKFIIFFSIFNTNKRKSIAMCNFQILRFSATVWYAIHLNFIFSSVFFEGPQGHTSRTTCGPPTIVWETLV